MHRMLHKLDHDWRRQTFRRRQFDLISYAAMWLAGFLWLDYVWMILPALTMIECARDEALRYRRTGHYHQTKRSIVRGSCPIDKACQQKLPRDCWDYRRQAC